MLSMLKFESTLDFFILFIIFIKVCFISFSILYLLSTKVSKNAKIETTVSPKLLYWKERTEFIFIACMAILLIYHFRPYKNQPISRETTFLFFLFGWILLFTAKWSLFFTESPWYQRLANDLS
jgi:multisubunit Na+/H+ antiporter MnhB subunit